MKIASPGRLLGQVQLKGPVDPLFARRFQGALQREAQLTPQAIAHHLAVDQPDASVAQQLQVRLVGLSAKAHADRGALCVQQCHQPPVASR